MIKELKHYVDKLCVCDIYDESGLVMVCFHQVQSKACYIAKEFSKCADEFFVAKNDLPDDSTINYLAKFDQNRVDDIAFINHCILKDTRIGGWAVYNIPILEYWLALECELPPEQYRIYVSEQEKQYYKFLLEQLYSAYGEQVNYNTLPNGLTCKSKTHAAQYNALTNFLNEKHPAYRERIERQNQKALTVFDGEKISEAYKKDNEAFYNLLDSFKTEYNLIYQSLIERGLFSPKWKSEYELFKMIKKEYPKAIYQYRARWLGHQSIDIFLPEEKIAFEYQGIQHYKPVDVFGGNEHFEKQKILDERKRVLCKENGVKLIEWRYDEPISKILLDKKMKGLLTS